VCRKVAGESRLMDGSLYNEGETDMLERVVLLENSKFAKPK